MISLPKPPTPQPSAGRDENRMNAKPNAPATIGILSLLGLLSALLSILIPALLIALRSPLFVGNSLGIFAGDIFGALIAVYLLTYAGIRSVTKAIGLVVASTFAYFVAWYSGASVAAQSGASSLEGIITEPLLQSVMFTPQKRMRLP